MHVRESLFGPLPRRHFDLIFYRKESCSIAQYHNILIPGLLL